jgi:valyl-tRNA synthetase
MEDFQFGEAQRQIYDFLWSEFCDWYIEIAKIRLRDEKGSFTNPGAGQCPGNFASTITSLYAFYHGRDSGRP